MNVADRTFNYWECKQNTNETPMKVNVNEAEQGYSFEVHVSEEKLMFNI